MGAAAATAASTGSAPVAAPSRPAWLSQPELCAAPLQASGSSLPGARPFARKEAVCSPEDSFCDAVEQSPEPTDSCFVANDNLKRAARESASARAAPGRSQVWEGTAPPRYLDRIDAHLHLTRSEHKLLRDNGFVVLDRLPYVSYAAAFHDIFQEQLPLYVGVDPILHAVFSGTERALEKVERGQLRPALTSLLKKARATLRQSRGRYDPETLRDLDIYLGVAWQLSGAADPPPFTAGPASTAVSPVAPGFGGRGSGGSVFNNQDQVELLVSRASGGGGLEQVELFGRERMLDLSQFEPRGHYAYSGSDGGQLQEYFRAVTWLSRVEFNIVSRGCRSSHPGEVPDPAETPREARAAMALADLLERAGTSGELKQFEDVYSAFAGRREDLPPAELSRLMRAQGIGARDKEGFDRLKAAVGGGFRRTARIHYMPQHAGELPVITTVLGPRVTPDIAPLTRLVHDAVRGRKALGAADVGYLLGHERAREHLRAELSAFPALAPALEAARAELAGQAAARNDAYGSWLTAVLALGPEPSGTVPSFMKRAAWADARMNSALVGYGQLRHAFVLLAAQGYDAYGCEIPDAYVKPLPNVFEALLKHTRAMRARSRGWDGLERVLSMLHAIAQLETSGKALPEAHRRWLSMVAEYIPAGGFSDSGQPPKWTGWYFDMFEDREHGATRTAAFIADYFTLTNKNTVQYLGADGPRLGVFVVDVGGEPRAMVGPVAKGYQAEAPSERRLDDAASLTLEGKSAPWRDAFAAPAPAQPAWGLQGDIVRCETQGKHQWRVAIRSDQPLQGVSITLLDHHADSLTAPLRVDAGHPWRVVAFELLHALAAAPFGVEAVHVRVETAQGPWDWFTRPGDYQGPPDAFDTSALPVRPTGVGPFGEGAPIRQQRSGAAIGGAAPVPPGY
jgi:hypothetical protein